MHKAVTTLTAATIALGLAASAPSAAQANPLIIVPAAAAAWLAGGILGGAWLGGTVATDNPAWFATPAAAPGPAVSVNSTTCRFTHAWVDHVWRRVQVCNNY
jgi:hypothetical protein